MRPEYRNLYADFQEIKKRFANAETIEEKLELLKIAEEIRLQAERQLANFLGDIDRMKKS